jgi:hypothetical protein
VKKQPLTALDPESGRTESEQEAVLDDLDLIHAALDEWNALEDVRADLRIDTGQLCLSSTFRLLVDRYAAAMKDARRVFRP